MILIIATHLRCVILLIYDVISLVECGVVYVGRWEAGLGHYIGWGTPACLSYQVTYL